MKPNIEQMKEELLALDERVVKLSDARRSLRQKIAEAQAVFNVGDIVTYEGAKYKWQIISIEVGYNYEPKYIGAKLKKDGSLLAIREEILAPPRLKLIHVE